MFVADKLKDYRLLDAGDGMKLESWSGVVLARPDPQVIWGKTAPGLWKQAQAVYNREGGGGNWDFKEKLPERWVFSYEGLKFYVRPTGFKHTGLFPEQAYNWDFIRAHTGPGDQILNLFAYTGGATLAAAFAGGEVTHVDAAKGMVSWAKENARLSGLQDKPVRYIVDDCLKFVKREQRREKRYEGVIMDPPSYGRGAGGEVWKLEEAIEELIREAAALLSEKAKYFIVNSYTTGLSFVVTENLLKLHVAKGRGGAVTGDDLSIPIGESGLYLPCGTTSRWQR